MKIKRIFARDMRQAIAKVRDEHGPDAVILSSRKVDGGVEVISAVDYDERAVQAAAANQSVSMGSAEEAPRADGSFQEMLGRAAKASGASRPGLVRSSLPPRRKIDVNVDDDLDENLAAAMSFAEETPSRPEAEPTPPPMPDIQWTQDPALQEMRGELKMLRALFEDQLTLQEWRQSNKRHPSQAALVKNLSEMGFGKDVCRKLADGLPIEPDTAKGLKKALTIIARHTPVTGDDIVERGGIVAVVGPTGVGKTTTVAKLAARYALRHGRQNVALVSTDNFRIGAQDQLRNFARILGVTVHPAANHDELAKVLDELVDKRLVLIDTAGMSQRDMRLAEQFRTLQGFSGKIRSYLVVSANTQLATLNEVARSFRRLKPAGCILTKVDEATSLGGVLTMVLRHQLPLAYLGVGQRVPEDIQPARSDKLIERAAALLQQYREEVDDDYLALTFGGRHAQ